MEEPKKTELKPCPICGAAPDVEEPIEGTHICEWEICCNNAPDHQIVVSGLYYIDALKLWNKLCNKEENHDGKH